MRTYKISPGGQDGSVLIIVLLVLALLTVIGISAGNMSTTELKIAGNDKNYKIAFYHAESGDYGMAKWAGRAFDDHELPKDINGEGSGPAGKHRFEYLDSDPERLKDEVMNYDGAYDDAKDLEFTMTSGVTEEVGITHAVTSDVTVNLSREKTRPAPGGGAEFGTGPAGIGESTDVEIPFWFTSEAITENGARATIWAKYVKRPGIPGGL